MSAVLGVRLPNWLGDVLMALPTLRAFAAGGVHLDLLGRPWAAELLRGHGWAVRNMPKGLRAGAVAWRTSPAQHALLLTGSFSSAATAWWGGRLALGFAGELRRLLLHRAWPRVVSGHQVLRYWQLGHAAADWLVGAGHAGPALRDAFAHAPQPGSSLGLQVSEPDRLAARQALTQAALPPDRPFVVLAPLATGLYRGHSKEWPGFSELHQMLTMRGWALVTTPLPGQESRVRELLPHAICTPPLGLGVYAGLLAQARAVVANDSGPMHLGAAVDAPTLGILGVTDAADTGPWGPRCAMVGGLNRGGWPTLDQVLSSLDKLVGQSNHERLGPVSMPAGER